MADEKTTIDEKIEEAVYIMPPHPEAVVVSSEATTNPGEPTVAEESISDLIQQAVDGLRSELKVELETQVKSLQVDLQAELQKELKGELEINVKG